MTNAWRTTTLGEVIELKRGYDLPEKSRRPGAVPVVSSSGVSGSHDEAKVKAPGVVTGRYGTLGEVFYVERDFWPLNTTLYVRDFKGSDPRFVSYFLKSVDYLAYSDKAAVPGVNRNHLHLATVSWPPRDEQRRIAAVLAALDDKIDFNRRMNETLEAMARALFKSWFVDFDPVRAKTEGRAPAGMDAATAALFPDGLIDSALGRVPRGWRVESLSDHLSVVEIGGRPSGGVKGITSGVPSVGAESIVRVGHFDFSKTRFVPLDYFASMRKGVAADRDVLLYKDGGRPGEFEPHVAMFGDGFPFSKFCINEHVYRLRGAESLPQAFLYFSLSSDRMMEEMRVKGTGVAIPGLNSTALRSLRVLLGRKEVVDAFVGFADPLVSRILAAAKESHIMGNLRDALLPKLLSGELRVRDAEKAVEQVA